VSASDNERIAYLRQLGIEDLIHTGSKSYLGHLVAVSRDLERWGCDETVSLAGLFHSIYGTERFRRFQLPLEKRAEVRELIGERAEQLAYWNCAMDRASFDQAVQQQAGPYCIIDRITRDSIELTEQDLLDLCRVHLFDWLEQAPRAENWDHRRTAYRAMADRLGGVAVECYERVFAREAEDA